MIQDYKLRHSRLGIASFVIAIAVGIIVPLVMVLMAILMASIQEQGTSKLFPVGVAFGLILILAYCGSLTGIGLGIAGIRQKKRNRIFAIIGLCLNSAGAMVGTLFVVSGLLIHAAPPPNDGAEQGGPGYSAQGALSPDP